jgi:hypothetical protein
MLAALRHADGRHGGALPLSSETWKALKRRGLVEHAKRGYGYELTEAGRKELPLHDRD